MSLVSLLLLLGCAARPLALRLEPVEPRDAIEARGQVVFARDCHACHPDGGAGLGPSVLTPPGWIVPVQVRLGLGAMPAFSPAALPAEDLAALRAWIRRMDAER